MKNKVFLSELQTILKGRLEHAEACGGSGGIPKHFANLRTLMCVARSLDISPNRRALKALIDRIFKRKSFLNTCCRLCLFSRMPISLTQCRQFV